MKSLEVIGKITTDSHGRPITRSKLIFDGGLNSELTLITDTIKYPFSSGNYVVDAYNWLNQNELLEQDGLFAKQTPDHHAESFGYDLITSYTETSIDDIKAMVN